ncbi:MAG: 2-dehydropantoate 2-reductase [Bacillaceae bacterium]|nr:2-dehydropantoate 2-reductase [Bacillaceae bacterium]
MDVAIVGGGSIGLLLGGYLAKCHADVTIYTRSMEQAEVIQKKGLSIFTNDGTQHYSVQAKALQNSNLSGHDAIFVTVKQYHLKQIVPELLEGERLNSLIFLQNGMGHLEVLNKVKWCARNILVGIVEHGALRLSHNEVRHTGVGEIKFGYFQKVEDVGRELVIRLTKSGLKAGLYQDWFRLMEKKLIVNALINPLTTIYRIENGQLLENPYYALVMQRLFHEISKVISISLEDWKNVNTVCMNTKQNRSSMLRDVECDRPTEIDSILGYILAMAKQKQKQMPLTEFIYESIKGIEFSNGGK